MKGAQDHLALRLKISSPSLPASHLGGLSLLGMVKSQESVCFHRVDVPEVQQHHHHHQQQQNRVLPYSTACSKEAGPNPRSSLPCLSMWKETVDQSDPVRQRTWQSTWQSSTSCLEPSPLIPSDPQQWPQIWIMADQPLKASPQTNQRCGRVFGGFNSLISRDAPRTQRSQRPKRRVHEDLGMPRQPSDPQPAGDPSNGPNQ